MKTIQHHYIFGRIVAAVTVIAGWAIMLLSVLASIYLIDQYPDPFLTYYPKIMTLTPLLVMPVGAIMILVGQIATAAFDAADHTLASIIRLDEIADNTRRIP